MPHGFNRWIDEFNKCDKKLLKILLYHVITLITNSTTEVLNQKQDATKLRL